MGSIAISDKVALEVSRLAEIYQSTSKALVEEILVRNLGVLAKEHQQEQILQFLKNFDVAPEVKLSLQGFLNALMLNQGKITLANIGKMHKNIKEG